MGCRTLARLDDGTIGTVDGAEVVARLLGSGHITPATLAEAEEHYGIPAEYRPS